MDTNNEYLGLKEAAALAPGAPNPSTLWRWMKLGIQTRRTNEYIRLQYLRIGAKLFTTKEWMRAFFDAVTKADVESFTERQEAARPKPRKTSSSVRRRQKESAKRVLREAKIIV